MHVQSFYERNLTTVNDKFIKKWIKEDLEIVEKALDRYKQGKEVTLSMLVPEYNSLIENGGAYTVSFARGPHYPLLEDLANKITEFDTLLVSIHRRMSINDFLNIYGFSPNQFIDLLKEFMNYEVLFPISMAPPWAYEKPRFYYDLIKKIENLYGYKPPNPWTRITEFFTHVRNYDWMYNETTWRQRALKIMESDRERVKILMTRFSRTEEELVNIITTKSCQLELFGLKNLLDKIIYYLAEQSNNFELLYSLITFYHKYLISSVLDYVGGVAALSPSNLSPGKLGISPKVIVKAIEPIINTTYPLMGGSEYKSLIIKERGDKGINIIKRLAERLRPRSAAVEYRELISFINKKSRENIIDAIRVSEKLDEVLEAYIEEKVAEVEKLFKVVDHILIGGLVSLVDIASKGLEINYELVGEMLNILLNLIESIIEDELRVKYREALRGYIRSNPLRVLRGQGIFWLVWAYRAPESLYTL